MHLRHGLETVPILIGILIALIVFLRHHSRSGTCDSLFSSGKWSKASSGSTTSHTWHPPGSILHKYDAPILHDCLDSHVLHFIGDSTIRQVFWATAIKLGGEDAEFAQTQAGKHEGLHYRKGNASLAFHWDPYLNGTGTIALLNTPASHESLGVIFSTGLWYARHGGHDFAQNFNDTITQVTKSIGREEDRLVPVIAVPPPHLRHDWLDAERAGTLTLGRILRIVLSLAAVERSSNLQVVWSAREVTRHPSAMDQTGLHVTNIIADVQADILLNKFCNDKVFGGTNKAYALPCVKDSREQAPYILVAALMSACIVVARVRPTLPLNYKLDLHPASSFAVLVSILLYCWVADRTTLFEKSSKVISQALFTCIAGATLFANLFRIKQATAFLTQTLPQLKSFQDSPSKDPGLLPRAQSEEWKGWMQIVILLYHYFGMSKVLWVYQIVRVLVGSYLFLTGYGHAIYFLKMRDFSLNRLAAVLLRLNLLPCLLALVMHNTWDFYYFPCLASIWFLVTYFTFWGVKRREHATPRVSEIVARVLVASFVLVLITQESGMSLSPSNVLTFVGVPDINGKELQFRVQLDLLAPFLGMLLATVRAHNPSILLVPTRKSPPIVALACCLFAAYVMIASQCKDKFTYNQLHPLVSILPISGYIMLRNSCSAAREYVATSFMWIGSCSLELFVLQYHIWLAADTRGLLQVGLLNKIWMGSGSTVVSSWTFWAESVLITIIFVWVSHHTSQVTNMLVKWFVDTSGRSNGKVRSKERQLLLRVCGLLAALWLLNIAAASRT
ncbi:hypothetical protein LTS08_004710 [Lithohypha guttulata]|nr:hypothetical protein LTS08_004710 [Lithohypha guttulata]